MSKTDNIYVHGEVHLKEDQVFANTALKVALVNLSTKDAIEKQIITLTPEGNNQTVNFKMHFDPLQINHNEKYGIHAEINSQLCHSYCSPILSGRLEPNDSISEYLHGLQPERTGLSSYQGKVLAPEYSFRCKFSKYHC